MAVGTTLFIVGVLIIAIWVIIEVKRFRHKLFAIFLIIIILFTYLSFTAVLKNQDLDLRSFSGITDATKLYFSWLGSLFANLKIVTINAIKMDWGSTNHTKT